LHEKPSVRLARSFLLRHALLNEYNVMKKIDYKTMSGKDLEGELKSLRVTLAKTIAKGRAGKNTKEYVVTRKNIARVMTQLQSQPAVISTEPKI
jgi:ribosomal protein L29